MGEYQKSLEMTRKAHEHINIFDFNVTLYECLATSALAWTLNSRTRRSSINHCCKLAKRMRKWADRCPANFLNKQLLIDAEIAAMKGKSTLALALYEKSASKAKMELFLHEEGIAYERLGRYQLHLGNISGAKRSLECCRMAFEKWGADIVVKRIEMLMALINEN